MAIGFRRRSKIKQVFVLVKEVIAEVYNTISSTEIDWGTGGIYSKTISSNTTFTFSNQESGKTILVIIQNTSGSDVTVTFPIGVKKDPNFSGVVAANSESIFTLINANNIIYVAEVREIE